MKFIPLRNIIYILRNNLEIQCAAQGDQGGNNFLIVDAVEDIAGNGAVELDNIEQVCFQIGY